MVARANNSARDEYNLMIELDEFDQIFERPDRSHVVIALRVTLRGGDGSRIERAFATEQPASTPDAAGGARALTQASDELIQRIIDWVAGAQSGAPPEQAGTEGANREAALGRSKSPIPAYPISGHGRERSCDRGCVSAESITRGQR